MSLINRIQTFNQGREQERLGMKYTAMRQSAFAFLRGTCHLFYEDWPSDNQINNTPLSWLCGDMHLENFGSFKGDNRLTYFDLNDFDEAALAPASWDLTRLLTSILVAAQTLKIPQSDAIDLCRLLLKSYSTALKEGKAKWLERDTAEGMIHELLNPLYTRNRTKFLASRTKLKKGNRVIKIDGLKALAITDKERAEIFDFLKKFAKTQKNPKFYKPLDAARRVAGTGSLGVARYAVLVEGRGSPDGNFLLDLKEELPSALKPYLKHPQPKWQSEAQRVVNVQQWVQAVSPAFLTATKFNGKSMVLKDLQPAADRLDLASWNGKLKRLKTVISSMGQLLAWGALRNGGRMGAASIEELMAFGGKEDWKEPLIDYAIQYAHQVQLDWQEFSKAYDQGQLQAKEK